MLLYIKYPFLFELLKNGDIIYVLKGLWTYESFIAHNFYPVDGSGAHINIDENSLNETTYQPQIFVNDLDTFDTIYAYEINGKRTDRVQENEVIEINNKIVNNDRPTERIRIVAEYNGGEYSSSIHEYLVGEEKITIDSISNYPVSNIMSGGHMDKSTNNKETINVKIGWRDFEEDFEEDISYGPYPSKFNGIQFDESYVDKFKYYTSNDKTYTIQEVGENKNITIDKDENIALVYVDKNGNKYIQECLKRCI